MSWIVLSVLDSEGEKIIGWDWSTINLLVYKSDDGLSREYSIEVKAYSEIETVDDLQRVVNRLKQDGWSTIVTKGLRTLDETSD